MAPDLKPVVAGECKYKSYSCCCGRKDKISSCCGQPAGEALQKSIKTDLCRTVEWSNICIMGAGVHKYCIHELIIIHSDHRLCMQMNDLDARYGVSQQAASAVQVGLTNPIMEKFSPVWGKLRLKLIQHTLGPWPAQALPCAHEFASPWASANL